MKSETVEEVERARLIGEQRVGMNGEGNEEEGGEWSRKEKSEWSCEEPWIIQRQRMLIRH